MNKAGKLVEYFAEHPNASIGGAAKATGTTYGYAWKVKQKIVQVLKRNPVEIVTASGQTLASANDKQVAGSHYKDMAVQPWNVVDSWPREQRIGYYRGGALKYIMRMGSKDQSATEIEKGVHYLEKLLEVLKSAT